MSFEKDADDLLRAHHEIDIPTVDELPEFRGWAAKRIVLRPFDLELKAWISLTVQMAQLAARSAKRIEELEAEVTRLKSEKPA